MARALQDQGFDVAVITGGLQAWSKGGHPVEPVPAAERIQLPSFAARPGTGSGRMR